MNKLAIAVPMSFVVVLCFLTTSLANEDTANSQHIPKAPTVLIVTLFRNKALVLPYFFSYLEALDYPKDRITLWFRSDHNQDNTSVIINAWLATETAKLYHNVNVEIQAEPTSWINETSITNWPVERHMHVIDSKEQALNYAKQIWADFIFFLDADVFLTDPSALKYLVAQNRPIIAPMLLSDGLYSNFWAGMTDNFYYQRTAEYKQIYNYNKTGEFAVPMIHSAVLLNLRDVRTDFITFNRTTLQMNLIEQHKQPLAKLIPMDDIIIFAVSAQQSNTPLIVSNAHLFGFVMVPLDQEDAASKDMDQLTNIKILIINDVQSGLVLNTQLAQFAVYPERDAMTLSKVVMINLLRRPERRAKMEQSFLELGIDVENVLAIDGMDLTEERIKEMGIQFLAGYADPFHNRPMTTGEIGCFLSHHTVWENMVERGLDEVLVLEDDIRFESYFKERAVSILDEARSNGGWDLIYFGRKRLQNQDEKFVGDSVQLVHAGYSYWTLGYVITLSGAKKLLAANPLKRMLPVDEFLPIMFDQHVNGTWKSAFQRRNLVAWSASPLIVFPTHYTGEDGYISDTEDSVLVKLDEDSNELPMKEKKGNKENYNFDASVDDEIDPLSLAAIDERDTIVQQQLILDSVADSLADTLLQKPKLEL